MVLKTLQVKLLANDEQRDALIDTFVKLNSACNYVSRIASDEKLFN